MVNTPEDYVYCFKSDGYLGVMSATKIYIPAAFDAIEIVPTKDRRWPFFAVVKMNDKYGATMILTLSLMVIQVLIGILIRI